VDKLIGARLFGVCFRRLNPQPEEDLNANTGMIAMPGYGGAPKTKGAKIIWWTMFTMFFSFVAYVLAKNFLF
jgi:hypothetical protein